LYRTTLAISVTTPGLELVYGFFKSDARERLSSGGAGGDTQAAPDEAS
jgi:hypothetical protein